MICRVGNLAEKNAQRGQLLVTERLRAPFQRHENAVGREIANAVSNQLRNERAVFFGMMRETDDGCDVASEAGAVVVLGCKKRVCGEHARCVAQEFELRQKHFKQRKPSLRARIQKWIQRKHISVFELRGGVRHISKRRHACRARK